MMDSRVEVMKEQLMRIAAKFENLTHPDVINASQRLDRIIVEIQRAQLAGFIQRQGYYPELTSMFSNSGQRFQPTSEGEDVEELIFDSVI